MTSEQLNQYSLIIKYGPNYQAVSDFNIRDRANDILSIINAYKQYKSKEGKSTISTTTSNMMLVIYFQAMVRSKVIPHREVLFIYECPEGDTHYIKIDKNGTFNKLVPGFCDLYRNIKSMVINEQ